MLLTHCRTERIKVQPSIHLVQDNIDDRNASHAVGLTVTMSGPQLTSVLPLQSFLQKIVTVSSVL